MDLFIEWDSRRALQVLGRENLIGVVNRDSFTKALASWRRGGGLDADCAETGGVGGEHGAGAAEQVDHGLGPGVSSKKRATARQMSAPMARDQEHLAEGGEDVGGGAAGRQAQLAGSIRWA
jgi:hypothetical protein